MEFINDELIFESFFAFLHMQLLDIIYQTHYWINKWFCMKFLYYLPVTPYVLSCENGEEKT